MQPGAGAAIGVGDDGVGLDQGFQITRTRRSQLNFTRAGRDDQAHIRVQLAALQHLGRSSNIFQPSARARTNVRLIDLAPRHCRHRHDIIGFMRHGNLRFNARDIDLVDLIVDKILVSLVDLEFTVRTLGTRPHPRQRGFVRLNI